MAHQLRSLVAEIDRIIASPYAVSLKILDNILKDCGTSTVQAWADLHAEKANSLITIVLEGLQLWPYTLGLLRRLVDVPSLRDVALTQCPTLLHDLLERADRSKHGFNEVSELCIILMSKQLPSSIALPALAQSFFANLFERAARTPCIETVEPIYYLLRGACRELLEILPQSSLDDFRDHLTRMMRTVKSIDDQLLSLYCLATIAMINRQHIRPQETAQHLGSDPSTQTSLARVPSSRTRDEVLKFYSGDRAAKTMHLLALQVIYACRADHTVSQTTTIMHVRLAREVATAVDATARYTWANGNPAIVRKLYEKVAQAPLYHAVQLEALCFISTLCDVEGVPSGSILAYQEVLVKTHLLYIDEDCLEDLLGSTLRYYAPRLDDSFWQSMMRTLILSSMNSKDHQVYQHRALATLLKSLQLLCNRSSVARSGMARALYSEGVSQLVETLISSPCDVAQAGGRRQREQELNIIALLLSTTLVHEVKGKSDRDLKLPFQLLEHQRRLASIPTISNHKISRNPTVTSIFERACSQDERGVSLKWRETLAAQLQMDSSHHHESVVRFVGQLCRDLEERCEGIEEPLRHEQANHEQTKEQCHNLEDCIATLEDQLDHKNDAIADLRRAKDAIENDFETAQTEADLIKEKAQDFETQLKRAREEMKRELNDAHRRHEGVKLEMQASIACRTEQLDDQEDKIQELKRELNALKKLKADDDTASENHKNLLEERLRVTSAQIESNAVTRDQESEKLAEERAKTMEVMRSLELVQAKAKELEVALKVSHAEHTGTEQSLRQQMLDQDEAYRRQATELQEHTLSIRNDMESNLHSYEAELKQTKAEYENKLVSKDLKTQELRKRIRLLTAESQQKSHELEEAQKMRAGLMSALGVSATQLASTKKQPIHRPPTFDTSAGAERDGDLYDSDAADDLVASESDEELRPGVVPTSSPAFEPTILRTKPRTAFKQPSMRRKTHVGAVDGGSETPQADNTRKRHALRQSVPNITSPRRADILKATGWTGYLNTLEPGWNQKIGAASPTKTPGRPKGHAQDAVVGGGKENLVPLTPCAPVGTYGTDIGMEDFDATTVEF